MSTTTPTVLDYTPAVNIPRVQWPFVMTSQGAVVVEQGSFADTLTQVQFTAACQIGECPELPTFGIPDLTFLPGPPSTAGLTAAIRQWVPDADETAVAQMLDTLGSKWGVSLSTSASGTGQ